MTIQRTATTWGAANTVERDTIGTNRGLAVGDFCLVLGTTLYRCTVAGVSTSTWVDASPGVTSHSALSNLDVPADHEWAALVDGSRDVTGDQAFLANVSAVGGVFSGPVLLAGAVEAAGVPGAKDEVIGDGTKDVGITLFADESGDARYAVTDALGVAVGEMRYDFTGGRWFFVVQGAVEMVLDAARLRPNSDGGIGLGTASQGFGDTYLSGTLDVDGMTTFGASVLLSNPSAQFTLGGGGDGSVDINLDKGATSQSAQIRFKHAGGNRWLLDVGTDNLFRIGRYNSSNVFQNYVLTLEHTTSDAAFIANLSAVDITATGKATINDVLHLTPQAEPSGVRGDIYCKTDGTFWKHNGSAWVEF